MPPASIFLTNIGAFIKINLRVCQYMLLYGSYLHQAGRVRKVRSTLRAEDAYLFPYAAHLGGEAADALRIGHCGV